MEFDEYQKRAAKYDTFPASGDLKSVAMMEKVLGLAGEAGETADKFKKILRDRDGEVSEEDLVAIKKELGDVLWYVAAIARNLGVGMSEVAEGNLAKLEDRYQRNKIHGAGDNR